MKNEKYIPFIHHYCDRWCEKCAFTAQCRVYEKERMPSGKESDWNEDTLLEQIHHHLQYALDSLREIAGEQGIQLEAIKNDAPDEEWMPTARTEEQQLLENEARRYIPMVDGWFAVHHTLFEDKQQQLIRRMEMGMAIDRRSIYRLNDAIEVIKWYQFFISAKIHRGLHGLGWTGIDGIDPIQNDANGSARTALLAIDNSLQAWEIIRNTFPDQTDEILDILLLLHQLRQQILHIFPCAPAFRRPGFDD